MAANKMHVMVVYIVSWHLIKLVGTLLRQLVIYKVAWYFMKLVGTL